MQSCEIAIHMYQQMLHVWYGKIPVVTYLVILVTGLLDSGWCYALHLYQKV
jgi:hypothetical protein